jgi:hypothetical protein
LKYIKLHRTQQQEERAFAAKSIEEAKTQFVDDTRQPKKAHLLIDAWTSANGDNPRVNTMFFELSFQNLFNEEKSIFLALLFP